MSAATQTAATLVVAQVRSAIEAWERYGISATVTIKIPDGLFLEVAGEIGQPVKSTISEWEWEGGVFVRRHKMAQIVKRNAGDIFPWEADFRGVSILITTERAETKTAAEYAAMVSADGASDPGAQPAEAAQFGQVRLAEAANGCDGCGQCEARECGAAFTFSTNQQ